MTGIEQIKTERQRQIDAEGYSAEHDDEHGPEALIAAGMAYYENDPSTWPWRPEEFKPKDRRRDLVRAGALLLAAEQCARRRGLAKTETVAAGFKMQVAGEIDRLLADHNDGRMTRGLNGY